MFRKLHHQLLTETVAIAAVDSTLDRVKTIQVKSDTKVKLDSIGRKGDTYDVIIRKLIEIYLTRSGTVDDPGKPREAT